MSRRFVIWAILLIFLALAVLPMTAAAWPTGYNKCREITNSSVSSFASGYEAEFMFSNSQIPYTDLQSGFVDMLITDGTDCNSATGNNMSFWRHPVCNKSDTATNCTIYIKTSSANQTSFLMYYNSSTATDKSNGWSTFRVFDDFNRANNYSVGSNWTRDTTDASGGPQFSISNNRAYHNGTAVTANDNMLWANPTSWNLPLIIEFESNVTGGATTPEYTRGASGFYCNLTNHYRIISGYSSVAALNKARYDEWYGGWVSLGVSYATNLNVTYNSRLDLYTNASGIVHDLYVNLFPAVANNFTIRGIAARNDPASVGIRGNDASNAYYDNFRVRLYVSNPPSWSVGTEKTSSGNNPPVITIIKPENTTYYSTKVFRNITATDDNAASLNITLRIDGVYNSSFNITNATYSTGNLTLTGGPHSFNISASDGPNIAYDVEYFYVWMGLNISLRDNATSAALQNWTVCFANSTTQLCNASVNNPAMFEWSSIPNGNVNITFSDGSGTLYYFNNTYQRTINNSAYENLSAVLQLKANSTVSLSASPAWTIGVNTQATISCSVSEGSPSLYRNGISISNPYVSTLSAGNYNFSCSIGETTNYAPYSTAAWLYVLSGGVGCSDNTTYAFWKNISTGGSKNVTLNFTGLVASGYVSANLTDVLVNTTNTSSYVNNSYLVVNTENVSIFAVYFGNFFAYVNHTSGVMLTSLVDNMTVYSEYNPHYYVMFTEEVNGSAGFPPGATNTMIIYCTEGTSWKDFNVSKMLIASKVQLDYMRGLVQYSATEFYYRDLLARSSVEDKNMYLVDANQKQVLQILVSLLDNTGEFSGSALKIKKWIGGNLETITEQLFDAEGKVIIYLINGDKYQIYVDNGVEERSIGFLFADSSDLTKTIQINRIITNDFSAANFSYYLNMTGGSIVFSFIDASGNAISSEFSVYNWTDRNGSLLYYANSTNHSVASYTYAVPDINGTYKVDAKIHHSVFGENTIELVQIFEPLIDLIPFFMIIEAIAGPMPAGLPIQTFVSICFVFFLALMFDQRHGATAGVIVVLFSALISYLTWWPVGTGVLVMAMVIAVLNKLSASERGVG